MIRIVIAAFILIFAIGIFSYSRMRSYTNLLRPTGDIKAWHWDQGGGASGGISVEQDALKAEILKTDGEAGNLSLYQETAVLKEGHKYRFTFTGKSTVTRTITAFATNGYFPGSDGGEVGMKTDFTLDSQWKQQEATFYAKGTNGAICRVPILYFGAGPPATIWLKDVRLEEAG